MFSHIYITKNILAVNIEVYVEHNFFNSNSHSYHNVFPFYLFYYWLIFYAQNR